ncbi:hypothetical protein KZX46_02365 (plasmid) [Polymorphobacter sp. PAMC 29334]|uniref:hypothetical protein n=1 Tax=Polymorphobacter sp. PAMC 29334 TaxID=2862331 RepID=UPI001C743180|nr:hypothetical protein [Polymorphobacter sp. PAMC 29334]QYE33003.1 hypothetical protein KZX46_02365 [Polymorphobacter sp. PAMC 29334]
MTAPNPSRSYHIGPTVLADIANLAAPGEAPRTIRFSAVNNRIFQVQRAASYPGGHAKEQGAIFADASGHLSVQNIGGLASTAGSFSPDLFAKDSAKFTLVGALHTHPYDRTEGSMNGVSFSGGDIAYQIIEQLILMIVQSGPRVFALLLTAETPRTVDYNKLNDNQNARIQSGISKSRTFQQSSRVEAQIVASNYHMAYYQGMDGVLTRVSPG